MLIGAMNHPGRPVVDEIEWMAAMGLDFIDLTLEPPAAAVWAFDAAATRAALNKWGLQVVGHTAFYLPFASPFQSIRRAAVEEAKRCLEVFTKLGVAWVNVHPDPHAPLHPPEFVLERNIESLGELLKAARNLGVGLMLENLPGHLSTVAHLARYLEPLPDLGLHLDIGHANLMVPENTADSLIAAFSPRLRHVHLHDNKGGSADLHLPLGSGNMDVARHVRALKASGYNGTITLEVFTADPWYLSHSRDVLKRLWDEAPAPASRSRMAAHV
jgi:sugar phosphate isomerase/epimerase